MRNRVKFDILKTLFERNAISPEGARYNKITSEHLAQILKKEYGHKRSWYYKCLSDLKKAGIISVHSINRNSFVYISKEFLGMVNDLYLYQTEINTIFMLLTKPQISAMIKSKIKEFKKMKHNGQLKLTQ
jgi:DNA-binding transcriptional regulator PaaX